MDSIVESYETHHSTPPDAVSQVLPRCLVSPVRGRR